MKKINKILTLTIAGSFLLPIHASALQKRETIYSTLNPSGEKTKMTVSNHLSFLDQSKIEDETTLKNILNIGGNETFFVNGNRLTWNTQEKDIYYEGEIEKELPIRTTIRYYLNDEEKELKDILGTSGTIKIQIHFENLEKQTVNVNGKNTELSTPFVTTVGMMLNSNFNKNISITNGKVVGTGSRNILVGIASPGLYHSMGLEELKNFDDLSISFETIKFELPTIYLVSTPKLLSDADFNVFSKMDSLYSNISELQKNMNTLESGVLELSNGIASLNQGSKELMSSLKTLSTATKELQTGSVTLVNGLKEVLKSLKAVKEELSKVDTSSFSSLETLKNQNANAVKSLLASTGMSETDLKTAYDTYQLKSYKGTDANLLALKNAYELIFLLNTNTSALTKTESTIGTLQEKLNTLVTSLDSAISKLEAGSLKLSSSISELKVGVDKIYQGSITLNQGANALNTGAKTLCEGTSKFNKQGIGALKESAITLKNYSDKVEALTKLSEEYQGFGSNNSNQTLFVSKVDSVKLQYTR